MVEKASEFSYFKVGEHIDCLDTVNKWCNAEVTAISTDNESLHVHYTGFSNKYDEWIDLTDSEQR